MSKFSTLFSSLLCILVLTLLIFIPLYPKFPLLNVKGTFVAIRLEDLAIAVCLGIWAASLLIGRRLGKFLEDPLIQALFLFFFIGLVSLFSGVFLTRTITPVLGGLHFLRRVELMLLMPFAYTAIRNKGQLKAVLWSISAVLLIINLYALGQKYFNLPVVSTTNSEFSKGLILYLTAGARVNSTFAGHYDLAVVLAMSLTLIAALAFLSRRLIYLLYLMSLSGLSFFVLFLTAARVSFISAAIGVVSCLIFLGQKRFLLFFLAFIALSLAYPSTLRDRFISTVVIDLENGGLRYFSQSDTSGKTNLNIPTLPVKTSSSSAVATVSASTSGKVASDIAPGEPVNVTELGVYRSSTIRLNYEWPAAIRSLIKNPLLGTGYSSQGLATDNDFLRSLAEVGLLGTIAFGLIMWQILKTLKGNFKDNDKMVRLYSIGIFSMVIAVVINGTFIDVFESSKVATIFWLLIGVGLSLNKSEIK